MGLPGVCSRTPASPWAEKRSQVSGSFRILKRALGDGIGVQGIDQESVLAVADDVHRPPFSVATRGSPLAAASNRVRPKGSVRAGLMKTPREALANR
jgi:hypothetical protein